MCGRFKEEWLLNERILAISDIHGCYDEFQELLTKIDFQSDKDQLYLVGDYMDRGPKSKEVIYKVKDLVENHGAVAMRGNHDQFFLEWIDDPVGGMRRVMINGGLETIASFLGDIDKGSLDPEVWTKWAEEIAGEYGEIVSFLRDLRYYAEDKGYIFVHAGIDPELDDWKDTSKHDLIWIREPFLEADLDMDEVIIHGHTPVVNLHGKHDIYYHGNKIGIDGGCAYGGQLNALEIGPDGEKTEYVVVSKQV